MNVLVMSPKYTARTGKLAPVANDMTVPTVISTASQTSAYRNYVQNTRDGTIKKPFPGGNLRVAHSDLYITGEGRMLHVQK